MRALDWLAGAIPVKGIRARKALHRQRVPCAALVPLGRLGPSRAHTLHRRG